MKNREAICSKVPKVVNFQAAIASATHHLASPLLSMFTRVVSCNCIEQNSTRKGKYYVENEALTNLHINYKNIPNIHFQRKKLSINIGYKQLGLPLYFINYSVSKLILLVVY